MATGITARHQRSCASRTGGRCSCRPTYQARVWDAREGRLIPKTFKSISAAKRWRTDAYSALRRGELSADRGPLLRDATDVWLQTARAGHARTRSGDVFKPATVRDYERAMRLRILPALGDLRVRDITTHDVQRFVDSLVEQGLAPATIDATLTALRAYFGYATPRGDTSTNPTRGIRKPAVRPPVRAVASPAEARELLAALEPADRPLWATAFYAGLRRGELAALRWTDVDLATGVIHVRRGWDAVEGEVEPKSRHGRRDVPIAAALRDYLDEHLLATGVDGRVFGSARQVRRTAERARHRWTERGLKRLTLHEGRHTFASLAIAAMATGGVFNPKLIQRAMGHASIQITWDLYGHLFPGSEAELGGVLDAFLVRGIGDSTCAITCAHPEETTV